MAREQSPDRHAPVETAPAADVAVDERPATTRFASAGAIPPVETAATAPAATASERAFGTGPGVQKLEALLASGTPSPDAVVELIDAHRDEHDAMFALVTSRLGAEYTESVRARLGRARLSVSRRELVAGDPANPDSGYLLVSARERGARWRTADGDFTGTAGRGGLDARYRVDEDDALHAHVGKDRTGTLAWERDGKQMGELYGRYGGSNDYEAGARRRWDVGGDTLTTGVRHRVDGNGATDSVFAGYRHGATTGEAALGVRDGHLAESLSVAHDFGGGTTGSAQLHHGPEGTTGAIAGRYRDATTSIDGSISRGIDRTALHLGASEQVTPELGLSGRLDHVQPDHGDGQTTLGLAERYRSGRVLHGLDLEAGSGARDYLKATGSLDAQLAPQLYGGVWGSSEVERGHSASTQLGASLTFTTTEKTALTMAGLVDQDGNLETRLQLDVFKSRIESIADLDKHKKSALVSVFLSYTQGSDQRRLDGRFGEPQLETGTGSQVTAGIRIKF